MTTDSSLTPPTSNRNSMAPSPLAPQLDSLSERILKSQAANNCDFQSSSEVRESLREYWDVAAVALNTPAEQNQLVSLWFDRLWAMHANDPHRHYHTAVHLLEMCMYFDEVNPVVNTSPGRANDVPPVELPRKDVTAILLAIFFHDAVYDGKSSTNEEDSAALFLDFAVQVSLDADLKSDVVTMILASKSHTVDETVSSFGCCLFLDLDMAVLGKEAHAYQNYAGLIRMEYSFVPHDLYCEKRATVLEGFVKKPIFSTDIFRDVLEKRAIANLNAEIVSLKASVIPGSTRSLEQHLEAVKS